MRNRLCKGLLAVAMFAMTASGANAAVLFSDNFNAENGGVGVLNYSAFANFTVTNGTVDLIGAGYFDFLPGNGLYIDLDGSTNDAGVLAKSNPLSLIAGNYTLYFDIAGNQRNYPNDDVLVNVFGANSASYASAPIFGLPSAVPFTTVSLPFTLLIPDAAVQFSFANNPFGGGDNVGALLDNVRLEGPTQSQQPPPSAPEPFTLSLLGTGVVGLVVRRRRAQA